MPMQMIKTVVMFSRTYVLEPSVVFQVNRDAGCPPGVTSNGREKTRRLGPFPNRSPGIALYLNRF